MGYSTSFDGSFSISPEPTAKLLRVFDEDEYYSWHIRNNLEELEPPCEGKHYSKDEVLVTTIATFKKMGFTLNGVVTWQGDEGDDHGKYVIVNNALTIYDTVRTYVPRDTGKKKK